MHWWRIGVFLNIEPAELACIEHDFRRCQECCDRMLAKWLEVDTTASWKKIKQSIQSAVDNSDGMSKLYNIMDLH